MNIQERLREKLYPYVTQCKRYKKSLRCIVCIRWNSNWLGHILYTRG